MANLDPSARDLNDFTVEHSTRWLQKTLNGMGFCAGETVSGIWGPQSSIAYNNWAAASHFDYTTDVGNVVGRIRINEEASKALQNATLPYSTVCTAGQANVNSTPPLVPVGGSRSASGSTGTPAPIPGSGDSSGGFPTWLWWAAGGALAVGLGAAFYFARKSPSAKSKGKRRGKKGRK